MLKKALCKLLIKSLFLQYKTTDKGDSKFNLLTLWTLTQSVHMIQGEIL